MNKKIISTAVFPLLFTISQSAHADYYYQGCPAGTTGEKIGVGFIRGDMFYPNPDGQPVYWCTQEQQPPRSELYETTANTLQIERTAYNTINQHLMSKVVREYTNAKPQQGAASGDSSRFKPDMFWAETNVSSLTEHASKTLGFASNIYQFSGGVDKRHGDFFYGAALTYAYTDNNLPANTDNVMHTVGVTPYMVYTINDFLFVSALGSYFYSNTSGSAGFRNIDTHDYSGEANLNAFKVIDKITLKGRAGVRYKHVNSSQKGAPVGRDNTFDELTGIVDAQVDYKFDNGLTLYTGALYNHYVREASAASNLVRGSDVVWMRYGAEYPVSKGFAIGAKIENDLNDRFINYLTGGINMRLEL